MSPPIIKSVDFLLYSIWYSIENINIGRYLLTLKTKVKFLKKFLESASGHYTAQENQSFMKNVFYFVSHSLWIYLIKF